MIKFIFLCTLFVANIASAVEIKDARVDASAGTLEVDIAYGGGCEEHKFELKVSNICLESFPVQCSAEVVDVSAKPDMCEAYLFRTVKFVLSDYKLNDSYFEKARFTIYGSDPSKSVTVILP